MNGRWLSRLRWRSRAGHLVTWMAVSFGMTVVITRLFLMSSGYPKIGGATYHIAHALFGGLLLVIAMLVTLLYASGTSMIAAAILSGVGLGLFIDEVGKFITSDNNYFFPLAAPIIYLAFLLIVALARYAARAHRISPVVHLSQVMEETAQMVGTRPGTDRRAALAAELDGIHRGDLPPEHVDVLDALSRYLHAAPDRGHASVSGRVIPVIERVEEVLAPQRLLAPVLIAVMFAHAVWSLVRLVASAEVITGWHPAWHPLGRLLDSGELNHHGWKAQLALALAAIGEVLVGAGYLAAAVQWLRGHVAASVRLGIWASVLSLTVVNVMATYFDQFLTVFTAIGEAVILGALVRYRTRFIPREQWHWHHRGLASQSVPEPAGR
ncbi:hypothetical protein [Antrihabitans cavernicola]|uniref:Uncharacterized protein n=1 Tax=Antrihabitans cavernicola TaxID=2495913 RepID=A0A5A7SFD9_9NOCA|nr:hypothetical protein [Spelaeibacter cavernicola]KAA0023882.1 hypothetical protein FOY51_04660 [Spelaeibacter cavernicola]